MTVYSSTADTLQLRKVSKAFDLPRERLPVLDEISLDIAPGEFVCIVGASGCGAAVLGPSDRGFRHSSYVWNGRSPDCSLAAEALLVFSRFTPLSLPRHTPGGCPARYRPASARPCTAPAPAARDSASHSSCGLKRIMCSPRAREPGAVDVEKFDSEPHFTLPPLLQQRTTYSKCSWRNDPIFPDFYSLSPFLGSDMSIDDKLHFPRVSHHL